MIREVVGQPVNLVTSLVMSGVGLALVVIAVGWPTGVRRRSLRLVGATLVATGLGSVAFHGPGGWLAHVVHDASVTALPLVLAVVVAAARHRFDPTAPYLVGLAVVVGARVATPAAFDPSTGLAALTLVIAAVWAHRGGAVDLRWLVIGLGLIIAGGVLHSLSRTGEVLCRPESLVQGHAVWHLLAALAVVAAARAFSLLPPPIGPRGDGYDVTE